MVATDHLKASPVSIFPIMHAKEQRDTHLMDASMTFFLQKSGAASEMSSTTRAAKKGRQCRPHLLAHRDVRRNTLLLCSSLLTWPWV